MVNDKAAEYRIAQYLKEIKKQGFKHISIIDLVQDLKLPAQQIDRVMTTFEKKGIVQET